MIERTYEAYGGSTAAFLCRDRRILVEGPANTGKSRGLLELANHLAQIAPGIRILFARQTLQSLRESILVTWENKVLTQDHPCLQGGASRAGRRIYEYPEIDGHLPSTVVLGGLEDPGWTYSMEYDVIFVFEAWEVSQDSLERLYRANRNHILCRFAEENKELAARAPFDSVAWMQGHKCWQQVFCDTNPAGEFHPLNQMAAPVDSSVIAEITSDQCPENRVFRADAEHPFTRILSRHEDNPACTEEDLENLRAMTGHRKARLYRGLWTSAEGLVLPEYDPTRHLLTATIEREGEPVASAVTDQRPIWLNILRDDGKPDRRLIKWVFATQDFGFTHAGVLGVWGVDYEDRLYLLAEWYRSQERDGWWGKQILEAWKEFDLKHIISDSEDPGRIATQNDRLVKAKGKALCRGVKKTVPKGSTESKFVPASLSLLAEELAEDRIFFVRGTLRGGRDEVLAKARKPVCTTQEIPSYTYPTSVDGRPDKETPDPNCTDDGCDMTRYAVVFHRWQNHDRNASKPAKLSAGWRLGHGKVKMDR